MFRPKWWRHASKEASRPSPVSPLITGNTELKRRKMQRTMVAMVTHYKWCSSMTSLEMGLPPWQLPGFCLSPFYCTAIKHTGLTSVQFMKIWPQLTTVGWTATRSLPLSGTITESRQFSSDLCINHFIQWHLIKGLKCCRPMQVVHGWRTQKHRLSFDQWLWLLMCDFCVLHYKIASLRYCFNTQMLGSLNQ